MATTCATIHNEWNDGHMRFCTGIVTRENSTYREEPNQISNTPVCIAGKRLYEVPFVEVQISARMIADYTICFYSDGTVTSETVYRGMQ